MRFRYRLWAEFWQLSSESSAATGAAKLSRSNSPTPRISATQTSTAAGTDTGRKHMGGGEFLQPARRLRSLSWLSAGTRSRTGDLTIQAIRFRAAFAGTPVVIDQEIYEVAQHLEPDPVEGRETHRYFLRAWDDSHPMRGTPTEYSVEAVRNEQSAVQRAIHQNQIGDRLHWFGVLVALLPAKDQLRLYRDYGFDAVFWTRWSALAWTLFWFPAAIRSISAFPWTAPELSSFIVIVAFLVEQFYRRAKANVGEPCGSMLGSALRFLLPRSLRG